VYNEKAFKYIYNMYRKKILPQDDTVLIEAGSPIQAGGKDNLFE